MDIAEIYDLEFYKKFSDATKYPRVATALELMDIAEKTDFYNELVVVILENAHNRGFNEAQGDYDNGFQNGKDETVEIIISLICDKIDWLNKDLRKRLVETIEKELNDN